MMVDFEDLVVIIRHLTDKEMLGSLLSGNLYVNTPELLSSVQACESDFERTGLTLLAPPSIDSVEVGSEIQIQIGTPRPSFGLLPKNLDELLKFPGAHVKEPAHYFLLDADYSNDDEAPSEHVVLLYRTALKFVAMLKVCAAFLDEQQELLVFIKEGKFELPVMFTQEDLLSMSCETISLLSNVIPGDMHRQQCASIMAEAVYEITAKLSPHKRFSALIEDSRDLLDRFEKGYQLFAAGFSYEKIRDEIEAARVEYSGKIHKVFSDIQNQVLGIPVATIIVATQMKESSQIDTNFLINIAILIGSFVFMLLMHFLIRNQKHTLGVIGIEIERQKKKLEKEHAAIASNFLNTFQALESRYNTQLGTLRFIDIIVFAGFVLSAFFFYNYSHPVQQWLKHLLISLGTK